MKLLVTILLATFAVQPAWSQDAKPTEDSIRQLFEVMHTSQLLDTYLAQVSTSMHASMHQAMQGKPFNTEQQQIMDDWGSELVALMRHELSWETVQPMMVEVYRANFTRAEVDAMLQFYRTPTGQAVISKSAAAMQQSMQIMQQRAATLTPKIQQLTHDTIAAMKRAQDRAAASTAPTPPPPPAAAPDSQPPPQ
jgi:hypothetical protein